MFAEPARILLVMKLHHDFLLSLAGDNEPLGPDLSLDGRHKAVLLPIPRLMFYEEKRSGKAPKKLSSPFHQIAKGFGFTRPKFLEFPAAVQYLAWLQSLYQRAYALYRFTMLGLNPPLNDIAFPAEVSDEPTRPCLLTASPK